MKELGNFGRLQELGRFGDLMELEGTKMILKTTGYSSLLLPQNVFRISDIMNDARTKLYGQTYLKLLPEI